MVEELGISLRARIETPSPPDCILTMTPGSTLVSLYSLDDPETQTKSGAVISLDSNTGAIEQTHPFDAGVLDLEQFVDQSVLCA
jgi:hypothetical protein